MAGVAYNGSSINNVVANNHIPIRRWIPSYCIDWDEEGNCIDWGGGYYEYSSINATISGNVNSGSPNVYVNGKQIARQGDTTQETDSYSVPSGWEEYNTDGGGNGNITSGNSSNVFVNGQSVSTIGSSVRTHANVNTSIGEGSSNVFIG